MQRQPNIKEDYKTEYKEISKTQLKILEFLMRNNQFDYQISDIASAINVQYYDVKREIIALLKEEHIVKTRILNSSTNMYQRFAWFNTDRQIESQNVDKLKKSNVKKRMAKRTTENGRKQSSIWESDEAEVD